MSSFSYKTRGNSSPEQKPKVYFCAHPKDYRLLDEIASELHKFQNCSIWYDQEPESVYDAEEYDAQLSQMQLFVMPITTNLLTGESRALQHDFALAQRENIPVLPLMQENGLDELFQKKCGDIQYLNKNINDITTISYEEKLNRFLNSVLVGDDDIKRIYDEFSARLFLSYRKKDRKYAQKLMRLIHEVDFCRDVAIWYDEFLTPSEDFKKNISDAINKCNIFVLAVTPNLLEADNYVMSIEYPMACKMKKPCMPVELLKTNQERLRKNYRQIPSCINSCDKTAIYRALKDYLCFINNLQNNSPEHLYYIGLAYLNGVDIEVNRERAIELIRMAAEENCSLAIKKMVSISLDGKSSKKDISAAIVWQEKLLELCRRKYELESQQENYVQLTEVLWDLGELYEQNNAIDKAIECYKEFEQIYIRFVPNGEFSIEVVKAKSSIAKLLAKSNDAQRHSHAWQYYSDTASYLSAGYSRKLSDSELLVVSNVIAYIATSIINGPQNIISAEAIQDLSIKVKRYRTLLETLNGIDFERIMNDSICHNFGVRNAAQFYAETGIINHPLININPETDYMWTNPLLNAEELLFVALGINEYLLSTDIVKYARSHSDVFFSIASLWMMMGYNDRAIKTMELSVSFLEKIQSDFHQVHSYSIARQLTALGQAYINNKDFVNGKRALEKSIGICNLFYGNELQYAELLAEAYRSLSQIADYGIEYAVALKKAAQILCVNNEAYLSVHSIRMSLIGIYTALAKHYVNAASWDFSEFLTYFELAHKLCKLCIESDKDECSLYLCELYNMIIFTENCKTTESMSKVIQCLNVAINNCKQLASTDSGFSDQAWDMTIDNLLKFDYYVSIKLTGEIAELWNNAFSHFIADAIEFFIELAENSPLHLLPHSYRHSFSDYNLISGSIDGNFIDKYNTLLFTWLNICIDKLHNGKLVIDKIELRRIICELYDSMIKCQKQGYAFQVFNKEKRSLLELLEK